MKQKKETIPTSLARKLLMVDELPEGALPRYERDISVKSYVIPRKGTVPISIVEAEELLVPIITISANPMIRINELPQIPNNTTSYLIGRAKERAQDSIRRQEDVEAIKMLNASIPTEHSITCTGRLNPSSLRMAMALIEDREISTANIVMHPRRLMDLRELEDTTSALKLKSPLKVRSGRSAGKFTGAKIYVTTMCPKNCVYLLASPQFVGAIPIKKDVTCTPSDNPEKLRIGWLFTEEIGFCVINDYAVARIMICDPEETLDGKAKLVSSNLSENQTQQMHKEVNDVFDKYSQLGYAKYRIDDAVFTENLAKHNIHAQESPPYQEIDLSED